MHIVIMHTPAHTHSTPCTVPQSDRLHRWRVREAVAVARIKSTGSQSRYTTYICGSSSQTPCTTLPRQSTRCYCCPATASWRLPQWRASHHPSASALLHPGRPTSLRAARPAACQRTRAQAGGLRPSRPPQTLPTLRACASGGSGCSRRCRPPPPPAALW